MRRKIEKELESGREKKLAKLHRFRIPFEDLTIDEEQPLGKGAHAVVYAGQVNGQVVAVKRVRCCAIVWDEDAMQESSRLLLKELAICGPLHHPNIIETIGGTWSDDDSECDKVSIVLELASKGSLQEYLGEGLMVTSKMLEHVACALCYLHSRKIGLVHRDIKPDNILVNAERVAKIADFGTAEHAINDFSQKGKRVTSEATGTINYVDPLAVKGESSASRSLDVFSFGVMMCEALMKCNARKIGDTKNSMHQLHLAGKRFRIPDKLRTLHPSWVKLLERCWQEDPAKRPKATYILETLRRLNKTVCRRKTVQLEAMVANARKYRSHSLLLIEPSDEEGDARKAPAPSSLQLPPRTHTSPAFVSASSN